MMTTIETVLGPINTQDLGYTLMHEHLFFGSAGITENYPELLGDDFMDYLVSQLTEAKQYGIDTMVCAETCDMGRNVHIMAEASRRSGMNIIAVTGWWMAHPHFFDPNNTVDQSPKVVVYANLKGYSPDKMADLFVREIRTGIAGTDIKAAILKQASDVLGVTPGDELALRAVARAHLQTKVPICLHSTPNGHVSSLQIAILKEEGVDLHRVKVDHHLDTADTDYLFSLLEQGVYLGMERLPGLLSQQTHARTLKACIDAGFASQLLPSHDHPAIFVPAIVPRQPGNGWLFFKQTLQPMLIKIGVKEEVIEELFTVNPRRFFEGK